MRNLRILTVLLFSSLFMGYSSLVALEDDKVIHVSMVQLLVSPEKYLLHKNEVVTVGYLSYDGSILFLAKHNADFNEITSAISIAIPTQDFMSSKCVNNYVRISGYFRVDPSGQYVMKNISRVESIQKTWLPQTCWKSNEKN